MKSTCPCCGGEVESDWPLADLDSNTIAWGGKIIRARKIQVEMLYVLRKRYPNYASTEHLLANVWGEGAEKIADPASNLRVHMSNLRRLLKPFGASVDVVYGQGWRLSKLADVRDKNVGHAINRKHPERATA